MNKSFEVGGPVELEIRLASGEIEIDPTLDGRVEIELTAHDEESQRLVDEARVELQDTHAGQRVLIDVPRKRGFSIVFGRTGIVCRVRCPHESAVTVRTKSADVSARGTIGNLDVTTASGDVEVERVHGDLTVKGASADVAAREVTGRVSAQTASGDLAVEVARGRVDVASASGDVTIEEAYGDVSGRTASGDQNYGAVLRGTVSAHSASGDVRIGVRRGSKVFLDCTTLSGDTTSELAVGSETPAGDGPLVELDVKTMSGDIAITRAPAPATLSTPQEVQQ